MKVSHTYKEIFKLKRMLEANNIPFEFLDRSVPNAETISLSPELWEFYQIGYPSLDSKNRWISVVEGFGSHGAEHDKLEIMGRFYSYGNL